MIFNKKLPVFTMLCGLPGSRKHEYAEEYCSDRDAVIISSKDIQNQIGEYTSGELFDIISESIDNTLACKQSVIYIGTNLRSKYRKKLLENIKTPCEKECVVIATPWEICYKNNSEDDLAVNNIRLSNMYLNWEPPVEKEGWDTIRIHYPDYSYSTKYGEPEDIINKLENAKFEITDYDPVTGHDYDYYLSEHLTETAIRIKQDRPEDDDLIWAALLHDIGKPYTQTIENYIWSYKHHENVAAYDVMFINFPRHVQRLDLGFLIQHHSDFDGLDTEEKANNWKEMWGNTYYDRLKTLYIADMLSKGEMKRERGTEEIRTRSPEIKIVSDGEERQED